IEEAYRLSESQSHYELLQITKTAPREEIKKAYFRLAKEYHPDRHFELGMEEVKSELNTLFARITEAYDTLVTDRKRKEYDTRLSSGKERKKEPANAPTSHELFVRGEFALKQGDLRNASYFFKEAIKEMPEKSEKAIYYLRYGQTLSRIPGKLREAEEAIKKGSPSIRSESIPTSSWEVFTPRPACGKKRSTPSRRFLREILRIRSRKKKSESCAAKP